MSRPIVAYSRAVSGRRCRRGCRRDL